MPTSGVYFWFNPRHNPTKLLVFPHFVKPSLLQGPYVMMTELELEPDPSIPKSSALLPQHADSLVREKKCVSKLQHGKYNSRNSVCSVYSVGPGEATKCLGSIWKVSPWRWHFSWGFWKMSQYLPCRNQFSLSSNKWGLKRQTAKLFI